MGLFISRVGRPPVDGELKPRLDGAAADPLDGEKRCQPPDAA
jgi:hypothetical protein